MGKKEGETGILRTCLYCEDEQSPIFLVLSQCGTRILRTACEVGLSMILFAPEPAHVPFRTEHKTYIAVISDVTLD